MWACGLDWAGPGERQVANACECGNEPLGSMKWGNFLTSCKPVSFSRRTLHRGVSKYSLNQLYRGKAISITNSQPVSAALVTQQAMPTRRIVLSSAACLAVPYTHKMYHKWHDIRKKSY